MQLFGMTSMKYRIGLTTNNIEMTEPFLSLFLCALLLLFAFRFHFYFLCAFTLYMFLLFGLMKSRKILNCCNAHEWWRQLLQSNKKNRNENHFIQHDCLGGDCNSDLKEIESSVNRAHFNFLLHGVPPKMWFIACIIDIHSQQKDARIHITI